jgi:hypothetical protein
MHRNTQSVSQRSKKPIQETAGAQTRPPQQFSLR